MGVIAPKLYRAEIGHLMANGKKFTVAALFYGIYTIILLVFVINPAVETSSIMNALLMGAFLAFGMYASYDLINMAMATLKDWPLKITLIDLVSTGKNHELADHLI